MISALSYFRLGQLMQEFLPHVLVNDVRALSFGAMSFTDRTRVVTVEHRPGEPIILPAEPPSQPIPRQLCEAFKSPVEALRKEIVKLQLKASYATAARMLGYLDRDNYGAKSFADDVTELIDRLVDELKYTTCIAVEGQAEEYYRADQLFGREVANRFPEAGEDIAEAGKCLALDRGTACVMHLQRVLECGLDALGKAVGLTKPLRDWGKYVEEIAKELERRFKTSGARSPDEQFYAEAHVTFDAIRRAWRNPSMHVEKTHTPDQAAAIFVATKSFMVHLTTKL